jgi:hypothetical protein
MSRAIAQDDRRSGSPGRLAALAASAVLLVAGGSGLLAAAFGSGPAAAAGSTTGGSGSGGSGSGGTLGGFTLTSLAEAVTAQYEQPNFPVPATPSLEFDEGYASTTDNYGPSGTATASSLYPGQVVANAGPELALLVPGAPLPPAPVWPVQAVTEYPQTPNTTSTDEPGVNMDAASTANGNTASATLGDDAPEAGSSGADPSGVAPSGSGNPLAGSSAIFGIGAMSATSSSAAPSTTANAEASATDTGISILDGLITIGSVTSTATAVSDGATGKLTGSTVVQNMDIAGEPVTVDATGISAAGQSSPLSLPISSIDTVLSELGITIAATSATDKVSGPSAARTLDGLKITIDLKTLDNAANMVATLLPASLVSQLPVALPNDQQLTLDLATVQVSSTASPSFSAGNSGNTGSGAAASSSPSTSPGSSTTPGVTGNSGTAGFTGSTGTGSTFSPASTGSATSPSSGGGSGSPLSTASSPASIIGPAFKGVGAALVLLGLLAATALAYAYRRADDASELLGTGCADGDPLIERFNASIDDLSDPTDFGGSNA